MRPFRGTYEVRFGEVDLAGVVHYPRYFDYMNRALEEFLSGALGWPARDMWVRDGLCFATVHLEADFHAPLRWGDRFEVEVAVATLGEKSITWSHRIFRAGEAEPLLEARLVTAILALPSFTPCPIPEGYRRSLAPYGQ